MAAKTWKVKSNISGTIVSFVYPSAGVVNFDVNGVSDEIRANLTTHGAKQKLADSIAGQADEAAAFERMSTVVEQLLGGEWSARKMGDGPRPSMLVEALIEAKTNEVGPDGMTEERITNIREAMKDKDTRKAVAEIPEVAAIYERMKLERAKARERAARDAAKAATKAGGTSGLAQF